MTPKERIYLDHNATTSLDPRVLHAMYQDHGLLANPSSIHFFGQKAKKALLGAREEIASYLKVKPREILFTSGGTEAINLGLRGLLMGKTGHIVSSDCEHSAVYETLQSLAKKDWKISFLPCKSWGAPLPEHIEAALTADTKLIVLSWVNSETGVKADMLNIASLAHKRGIPLLVDGVSLMGKEIFEIPLGVSAMAFSGHKFHAPKGTGFLYFSSDLKLEPLFTGGGQEFGKRPGTENLEGILGLAKAVSLLKEELPAKSHQMQDLRDHFELSLRKRLGNVHVNGEGPRVVNVSNLYFEGIDGEDLLLQLDMQGLAASHGSACSSGSLEPSRVLVNMGYGMKRAKSSLRFSLSRFTTKEEIDQAIAIVVNCLEAEARKR